jgi:autotransporter-associated beta strand protein
MLAWCVSHGGASAVTGTWNLNGATPWTTAASWLDGVIPNGEGDTANFTFNLSANRNIPLNGDKRIGNLIIGDSVGGYFGYTLSAGSPAFSRLIFDQTGTADATLTVPDVGGSVSNVLLSTMQLNDNLVVSTNFGSSSSPQATLSGFITDEAGSYSLTKTGPGILQLSGANRFDGGVRVAAGRITCNTNIGTLGSGPVTVETGGQVFLNLASSLSDFTLAGSGYANSADTAAQGGALRLGHTRGAVGNVTIAPAGARIGVSGTDIGFLMGTLAGSGDLSINGPTTTTGSITLHGSAAGFTGTLFLVRGGFRFNGPFGGSIDVASGGSGAIFGTGTTVAGNLILDSISAQTVVRNLNGTLAIGGKLTLYSDTMMQPATFPAPGGTTLTLMTYSSKEGDGTLVFDATGYRGSPVVVAGPTAAVITGLDVQTRTWNPLPARAWDLVEEKNWSEGDGFFKQGDTVVFSNAGAGTVNLAAVVTPASVTFTNTGTNDYVISGTGAIDGAAGGITKHGDAFVTLGGVNTFSGPVQVNAGRLILGTPQALGFTSGVTVAAGATLDLNGQLLIPQGRQVDLTIAGSGDVGQGALTNAGATIQFQGSPRSGVRNVTLTADAVIGCDSEKMYDIGGNGILNGGGHTLTKIGGGQLYLLGATKNLNLVVAAGMVSGFGPDPFGTNLTIGAAGIASAASQGTYTSNVTIESGGTLQHATGIVSQWTGTITALGNVTLSNANTSSTALEIHSSFPVPGNLARTGNGLVVLLGEVAVGGSVTIDGGSLILGNGGNGGSLGNTASITLTGLLPRLTVDRGNNLTMPNLIAGAGDLTKAGVGTLTLEAANSYTGTTTVSAGGLIVNGTQSGTGAVTVAGGATLGGNGKLSGAVTVQSGATLAPGSSAGVLSVGSATIQGTLRIEYGSAGTDQLACSGALTLATSSALALEPLGPAPVGTVLPIARYSTLTGTFGTVTGVPEGYNLVLDHAIGAELFIALVPSAPPDPYLTWIGGFYPGVTDPLIIGPNADPDGDRLSNILENYLGTRPSASSPGLVAVSVATGSLRFRHSRADQPLAGYVAGYEWSTDLATWHAAGATVAGTTVAIEATVAVDHPSPANDEIEVRTTVTGAGADKLFVRLKLTGQ